MNGAGGPGGQRTRRGPAIALGAAVFLLALGYQVFVMPQSYSATSSLSVQQPQPATSALAALAAQSGAKKYIGILHSRTVAEHVEKAVDLRRFYDLPSTSRAVLMLMDSLRVEDRPADGLLYVSVTLPGPPKVAPGASERRQAVKDRAALAANRFVAELEDYYANNDNERDSVLRDQADQEVRHARRDYANAVGALRGFVRGLPRDPHASPAMNGNSGPSELVQLSQDLSTVEADLRAAEAAQRTQVRLTDAQLQDLDILAGEDPLLREERDAVNRAAVALDNMRAQGLADSNPLVVAKRDELRLARQRLQRRASSVRDKLTSDQIAQQSKIDSLRAKRDSLLAEVNSIEGRLPVGRNLSTELEARRNDLAIALEYRKTAEAEAARTRMSAVSARSRLSVVDPADAPEVGTPGFTRIGLLSLALGVAAALAWIGVGTLRAPRDADEEEADYLADAVAATGTPVAAEGVPVAARPRERAD